MESRSFDNLESIQSSLKTLQLYNQYVLFPVDEKVLDNPQLEFYLKSPLDSPIERDFEKIICVAGIKAVYDNPNIPTINKERCARNTARDLRECLRITKLEYHRDYNEELSIKEYNKRKRALGIVSRRQKVQIAKSILKNVAITTITTAIAGPTTASIIVGARLLRPIMPDKIVKPIENKVKEIKERALSTIENCIENIKSTSIGKVVQEAIDKVKPTINKVANHVKKVTTKIKDKLKSFWPF